MIPDATGRRLGRRAALGGALGLAAGAGLSRAAGAAARFPLRLAKGRRYLEDADGTPFFLQGDTAWSLIAQLRLEEAEDYLADRQARGFNTLLVSLIEHQFARNAPANAYGEPPFRTPGDYAAPNEAYFAHADRILARAAAHGFLVLLTPSYLGTQGGEEGWYRPMVASGPETLRGYGAFLGRRYRGQGNILWVHGGDYDPPDRRLVMAIADGIRQHDRDALHTAHCGPETAALDYWADAPWLQLNTLYTYRAVAPGALAQYTRPGALPYFLIESAYENEHEATEQRLRAQAYGALLCGATGQVFGNNPIWHFDAPGARAAPVRWREALDGRGSRSMSVLRALVAQLPWWLLEPDLEGKMLIDGSGGGRALAALATDRSCALLYLSGAHAVTVDLGQLRGPRVAVRWHDPATGRVAEADAPLPAARSVRLRAPGTNGTGGTGGTDWVLRLHAHA